ncbi:uncharacterized protein [Montipora capricornis]|uniref:uncharacterized protein n=1 Tax=Montipora capricornis TaxID=246305 RepID=UPI0035F1DDFD
MVRTRSLLQLYNVGEPMELVAIDVLGPLPETESRNKYILIAMDYFSKWPEAYALPNQEAVTVASVLVSQFFTAHETTKLTPAMLMFGRELRFPLDLLLARPQADIEELRYLEYAERLRASIATVHDSARDHQQAGRQRMKRLYDIRSEAFTFKKGGLV